MLNSDSPIAQSVERRTVNPQVVGSSPTRGAIPRRGQKPLLFLYLKKYPPIAFVTYLKAALAKNCNCNI